VAALPPEHLRLKVGRKSAFAQKYTNYTADGGPFELRYVAPERDDLIAVWYRTFLHEPVFPPVLTTSGWLIKPNSALSTEVAASVVRFFEQTVADAKAAERRAELGSR
jgi:hypothetical protein